jgi:hypothetical protein
MATLDNDDLIAIRNIISEELATLNNFNPSIDIVSRVDTVNTSAVNLDIHSKLDSYINKADWKLTDHAIQHAIWRVNLPLTTIPNYNLYPQGDD